MNATCYISANAEKLSLEDILKLQIAINGQVAVTGRIKWERWPLIEPLARAPLQAAAWKGVLTALAKCAAIIQAVRLPFDDDDWAPPVLLNENAEVREKVKQIGAGFEAVVKTLVEMLKKPDIDGPLRRALRLTSKCHTREAYEAHHRKFDLQLKENLEVIKVVRGMVLAFMDAVALTGDDIKELIAKAKADVAAGISLDQDRDGDFDVDDMSLSLCDMLDQQRVTSASESFAYIKTVLALLSASQHIAEALAKASPFLSKLGPPASASNRIAVRD